MSDPIAPRVCKACGGPATKYDIQSDGLCGPVDAWKDGCTQQCEAWYASTAKKGEELGPGFTDFKGAEWQVVVDKWLEAGCPGMVRKDLP